MEIVHCKECKYALMTYSGEAKYCLFWQNAIDDEDGPLQALYLDGDFFCAGGEKKDDSVKQITYEEKE